MIGLREEPTDSAVRTFDGHRALERWHVFGKRYGMPFATEPKERPSGTGRGCRAVAAAGLDDPGRSGALFARSSSGTSPAPCTWTTPKASGQQWALLQVALDDPDVVAEYERQRAEARSAEGTPAHMQDKTTVSDGSVRYTAPSVVFRRGQETAVAGGWQPLLSYDTVLANFAPGLERVPPPESPEPLLDFFSGGLTTAEVALLLAEGSDPIPDREAASDAPGRARGAGPSRPDAAGHGCALDPGVAATRARMIPGRRLRQARTSPSRHPWSRACCPRASGRREEFRLRRASFPTR